MRFRVLASVAVLSILTGCSENTAPTPGGGSAARQVIAPSGSLDQNIDELLSLFPEGLAIAGRNRWGSVKAKYEAGRTDPAQMGVAKKQLFQLAQWVQDKAPRMSSPPNDESVTAAAARLTLYMSQYVYQGPETEPPPFIPAADATVGLVAPTEPATIVTPREQAGVALEEGSVAEETIIVVSENPTPYPENCSGPLDTKLCQYPKFYHFSQFPHVRLQKAAKFAVCHVNSGSTREPLADHDRFRLAHTKPADPADYTPGSTIRDGIEILPLIHETFSVCDDVEYALNEPHGLSGALTRLAKGIGRVLTPRNAYAIDQGGGGMSFTFSDFNDVDPDGTPDDSVTMTTSADTAHAGDHVTVTYTMTNVGTATSPTVPASIRFNSAGSEPESELLTTVPVPTLVPGQSTTISTEVTIPESATPGGQYTLSVLLGTDELFPDTNVANDEAERIVVIDPSFGAAAREWSVGEASVCALTASNAAYCWGENGNFQLGNTGPQQSAPFQSTSLQLGFVELARGVSSQFYCGIKSDRSAACWGRDGFGQLGRGSVVGWQSTPGAVVGGITWAEMSTSRLSACGVSTSGEGYCWGSNQRGEVGNPSVPLPVWVQRPEFGDSTFVQTPSPSPVLLDGGLTWKSVVAGWLHACGITTTGEAYCWGDNRNGQVGVGVIDTLQRQSPTPVSGNLRFIQLSASAGHTCGITVDHKAYCWGENFTGQVGNGVAGPDVPAPVQVGGDKHFAYIAAGSDFGVGAGEVELPPGRGQASLGHTCALTETGEAWCWGWNSGGQLGNGSTADSPVPVPVAGSLKFTSIAGGGAATCGRNGNRIWCWGGNEFGQLGIGTLTNASTPTLVSSPFDVP